MKPVFLALLLAATIPAQAGVVNSDTPAPRQAGLPFNDPEDGMIRTRIKSGVIRPGDAVQDPLGARHITGSKPKSEKAEKPLGMG